MANKRHGQGNDDVATDGAVYEGAWYHDKRHGHGKMTYADDVYDGMWKDGKFHGRGTMRYADGDVYEGAWEGGYKHGHGKQTYAHGGVYEGNFKTATAMATASCRALQAPSTRARGITTSATARAR